MATAVPDLSTLTRLGQGHAAEVFALGDDRVIEVARDNAGNSLDRGGLRTPRCQRSAAGCPCRVRTVAEIARELGLTPSSLRSWVVQARADRTDGQTGLTTEERAELAELRKELDRTYSARARLQPTRPRRLELNRRR